MTSGSGRSRRVPILLALLAVAGAALILLFPQLRRMMAEARRLEQQAAQVQASQGRAMGPQMVLSAARIEADRKPRDVTAQLYAARAALGAGLAEEARKRAEGALRADPGNAEALFMAADLRRRARDYWGAIEAYRAIVKSNPQEPRALAGLASLYVVLGWPMEAARLLEPAVQEQPDNLPLKVSLALAYHQHEQHRKAEEFLQQVRRVAPDQPRLWAPLIEVYLSTNRNREALELAREALERAPEDIALRNMMGIARYKLGQTDEAQDVFEQTLASHREDVTARYYLGLCFQRKGRIPDAIRELEAVRRVAPGYEKTGLVLGRMLVQSGRAEEGRRMLAEAEEAARRARDRLRLIVRVAGHPDDPEAHFALARAHHADGDLARAGAELQRTLELAPTHAGARALQEQMDRKP